VFGPVLARFREVGIAVCCCWFGVKNEKEALIVSSPPPSILWPQIHFPHFLALILARIALCLFVTLGAWFFFFERQNTLALTLFF